MSAFFDVELDASGDLPIRTRHIRGLEQIAQRVRTRLQTWAGEWFLDLRRGLPYLEWRQQKPPQLDQIRARIQREIRQTPGVDEVRGLEISFTQGTIYITGQVRVDGEDLALQAAVSAATGNAQPTVVLLLTDPSTGTVLC